MRNIAADPPFRPPFPSLVHTERNSRSISPTEVASWLELRLPRVIERWLREVQGRYDEPSRGINGLLEEFLTLLASFLPAMLGPHRDQVEPIWIRASELFGAVAARRGLAAGEVIEEMQMLREGVIRLLYQDPPMAGRARISLREVLRLNRAVDTGVTHASVGHTDAMFFSLFEGSGIPDAPPPAELMTELREQIAVLRRELTEVIGERPRLAAADDASADVGAESED